MTLRGLIEAVDRGEWPGEINGIARAVFPYHEDWRKDHGMTAREAYNGSLDAAKRLHDALLPGWDWCSATDAHKEQWFSVGEPHGDYETEETYAENPARAWLLAILRALEGEP